MQERWDIFIGGGVVLSQAVVYPVQYFAISLIYFALVEVNVYIRDGITSVSESRGYYILGDVEAGSYRGPAMSSPVWA